MTGVRFLLLAALGVTLAGPAAAVGLDEKLGEPLPLDLPWRDHTGREVLLRDVISGDRPTILVFAWYHCPMLCGLVIQGLARSLAQTEWTPGEQFDVVTVSIDPKDGPHNADLARSTVLGILGTSDARTWPFLVGRDPQIEALANAAGFRFRYDARTKQYEHPAAAVVLTPDGRVSRYLYGVDFPVRDVKLALLEAGEGRIGSVVERFVLTCFRYDPATRRYGPSVQGFLRIGSALVAGALGLAIWRLRRREREGRPPQ